MKPILFNTEMVQAILDGRKTVTRRIVKPQPTYEENIAYRGGGVFRFNHYGFSFSKETNGIKLYKNEGRHIPYQVGDILYVRETFLPVKNVFYYKADNKHLELAKLGINFKWRPSIHMPKKAARIFLKVTGVRVERLHNITIDGVEMEGIPVAYPIVNMIDSIHLKKFIELWNSTTSKKDIDKYSWNANPFIWVYEFERIDNPNEK